MSHRDKWLTLISSPFRRGIFKIIVFECQSNNKKPILAGIIAVSTGKKLNYAAGKHDGWVWIRQPRGNGQYGYMVCRDGSGKALGKFE